MIRLVAVDMDGTLLNNQSKVSEKNAKAIREFQQQGGLFMVNTGRGYVQASRPLREAGISCEYICLSGACIYDAQGNLQKSDCLAYEDLKKIISYCKENLVHINYLTDRGTVTDGTREEMLEIFFKEVYELEKDAVGEFSVEKAREQMIQLADHIQCEQDIFQMMEDGVKFYKLSMNALDFERLLEVKEELRTWPQLEVASSFRTNIEVNSNRVEKGKTLIEYAESLGISKEEIMVIGDSENDIPMLAKDFGYTVAMGNALEPIKAMCKKITLTNEEDGVAYAIKQWAK